VIAALVAGCDGGGTGAITLGTVPCAEPSWWPGSLRSASIPVELHTPAGFATARAGEILAIVERDWAIETGEMGFREPLRGGACGHDDAVDVFVWPGISEAYVDSIAAIDATAQDDWTTYLVVDPDGTYGGDALPTTLAHELDHMCQAVDDWDEPIAILEATSTYVEAQIEPQLGARALTVADFQAHPGWSVDHDDGYETWFMYGAELYLEILRAARFDGHAAAIGDLWLGMRNTGEANEPDWADAVRAAVAPATFEDTLVDLAIWRWYTGAHADGRHLAGSADLPAPALAGTLTPSTRALSLDPIDPLATAYLSVPAGTATVHVAGLSPALTVRMLALPGTGGNDADELPVTDATATIDATAAPRTLAIVVLTSAPYDPDTRPAAAALDLSITWP
jgi:hypothetical protein